ncbi:hypothetical protein ACFV42_23330 [Streptomyces solisilvae]|uniref:hypothetical protein n=1 Tax=Streptomyces malaysiensis TaxID=92644 RepID=UPI0036D0DDC1
MTITTAYEAAVAPTARRERPDRMVCDKCGAAAPMPETCRFQSRWDEGWRWRGALTIPAKFASDTFVFSCPDCPPVI